MKINILSFLGVFVLLLGMAQPAAASRYAFGEKELWPYLTPGKAYFNGAISKFEGLLNAYSKNHKQNTKEQLLSAGVELNAKLNEFNTALTSASLGLTDEEKLKINNAYSEMTPILENLTEEEYRAWMETVEEVFKKMESGFDPEKTGDWQAETN